MRKLFSCVLSLFWIGLLALSQTSFADTPTNLTIPLKLENDRLTIEVDWAGHRVEATLDSAATFPLIGDTLANTLKASKLNQTVDIFGLTGLETYPIAETGPLKIDTSRLATVLTAVNRANNNDLSDAILPISLIEGRTLDFQFSKYRLDVYNFAPRQEKRTVRSRFDYQILKGVPFIEVELNGVKGLALVDTGSDVTYINRAFAREADAAFLPDRTLEIFGTGPDVSPVRVMRIHRFDLGDHRKDQFELLAADTPVFDYVGRADAPTMVLGMDTLGSLRLQIDREAQEIILSRRESRAEGYRYEVTPMSGRIKRRR